MIHRAKAETGGLFVRDELTFIAGAKVAAIRIFPEADKDQFEIAFAVSASEQAERDDSSFAITLAQSDGGSSDF